MKIFRQTIELETKNKPIETRIKIFQERKNSNWNERTTITTTKDPGTKEKKGRSNDFSTRCFSSNILVIK